MSTPADMLADVAEDEWSDPVVLANTAVEALQRLTEQGHDDECRRGVEMLRERRADNALLLAVAEAADLASGEDRTVRLRRLSRQIADVTWADELGLAIAHHASLGVVSLGAGTLRVLESVVHLAGAEPELFADRRAIARGLGYLNAAVMIAPPEEAEAILIPAAAVHGARIWTTARLADLTIRAGTRDTRIVVVAHPLATLSDDARRRYRPPSALTDLRL